MDSLIEDFFFLRKHVVVLSVEITSFYLSYLEILRIRANGHIYPSFHFHTSFRIMVSVTELFTKGLLHWNDAL